jgi:hypothetical protein
MSTIYRQCIAAVAFCMAFSGVALAASSPIGIPSRAQTVQEAAVARDLDPIVDGTLTS